MWLHLYGEVPDELQHMPGVEVVDATTLDYDELITPFADTALGHFSRAHQRVHDSDGFAADYNPRSVLHLYVNVDNDAATGRDGYHGCDRMLTYADGGPRSQLYADGGSSSGQAPRVVFDGPVVYLCADVDLHQADGRSVFELMVLSEQLDPHKFIDRTDWIAIDGPG